MMMMMIDDDTGEESATTKCHFIKQALMFFALWINLCITEVFM